MVDRATASGIAKANRPLGTLFTMSIIAGAFVAFGGTLSVIIGQGVPGIAAVNPGIAKLLSGLAFPVGLFLIVMFGADLFTGNNSLLIPGWHKGELSWVAVVRNWTFVWLGNFVGALLFTFFMVAVTGIMDGEPYRSTVITIAQNKTSLTPLVTFFRGIGANWCVCLAVWMALAADSIGAKALCVWIPVAAFVALGYEHCIANMFYIPCGMLAGADISWSAFGINLLFSTIGNIVGGALFVGHIFTRLYTSKR